MKNEILILCGKSASGKDTAMKEIVKKYKYKPIISWTSRPKRNGEKEGVEYHFCTKREFEMLLEQDKLVEYRKYNTLLNGKKDTWFYGNIKDDYEDEKYVIILDLEGAKSFIDYYGKDKCYVVYFDCDENVRKVRAMRRGGFEITEWNRRCAADNQDFKIEKVNNIADFIVNSNNKNAETIADEIAKRRR